LGNQRDRAKLERKKREEIGVPKRVGRDFSGVVLDYIDFGHGRPMLDMEVNGLDDDDKEPAVAPTLPCHLILRQSWSQA